MIESRFISLPSLYTISTCTQDRDKCIAGAVLELESCGIRRAFCQRILHALRIITAHLGGIDLLDHSIDLTAHLGILRCLWSLSISACLLF